MRVCVSFSAVSFDRAVRIVGKGRDAFENQVNLSCSDLCGGGGGERLRLHKH